MWFFHFLLLLNSLSKLSFSSSECAITKTSFSLKTELPIKAIMFTLRFHAGLFFFQLKRTHWKWNKIGRNSWLLDIFFSISEAYQGECLLNISSFLKTALKSSFLPIKKYVQYIPQKWGVYFTPTCLASFLFLNRKRCNNSQTDVANRLSFVPEHVKF